MPESYQLKTQLSATGKKIYYKGVASHIIVDPDLGDASDNWLTDKWGNLSRNMTPVIGIYETYSGLPAATGQDLGAMALVSTGHLLYKVVDSSGTNAWVAQDKGVVVDGSRMFLNTNDDKIYRWDGSGFEEIAGGNAAGAPVIFANKIQSYQNSPDTTSLTPGKTRTILYQPSTDGPKIVRSVLDSTTGTYVWDTQNPIDIATLYPEAWMDALYIETSTGRLWTVSTEAHLAPVTMGTYTRLIVFTEQFGGSGWEYAVTGSQSAPTPSANGRCLIISSSTNASTGVTTITPLWCLAVSDGQGGYAWDTQHPVDASADLSSSYIYYATATGKLYMYVDGNGSLTCIAQPSTGTGSNISLDDVTGLSNTAYPNPVEWSTPL